MRMTGFDCVEVSFNHGCSSGYGCRKKKHCRLLVSEVANGASQTLAIQNDRDTYSYQTGEVGFRPISQNFTINLHPRRKSSGMLNAVKQKELWDSHTLRLNDLK